MLFDSKKFTVAPHQSAPAVIFGPFGYEGWWKVSPHANVTITRFQHGNVMQSDGPVPVVAYLEADRRHLPPKTNMTIVVRNDGPDTVEVEVEISIGDDRAALNEPRARTNDPSSFRVGP
jgi:hypothetical protein